MTEEQIDARNIQDAENGLPIPFRAIIENEASNGALTLGYQVDTDPASVSGLPDDVEDTAQIITNHEAVKTPAEESFDSS
jgi:hypothetical protein